MASHLSDSIVNEDALTMFLARKAKIDAMLCTLTEASEDYFGTSPDRIDWGNCGSLKYVADKLIEICEHLNLEPTL